MQLSSMIKKIVGVILIIGLAISGYIYIQYRAFHPSTDDAYVNAHVVHVAAQISGPVHSIAVQNYEHVAKGQLLLVIDPRPYQIAVHAAQAKLDLAMQKMHASTASVKAAQAVVRQRMADVTLASNDAKRILKLVDEGQATKQQGDQVRNRLAVAQAGLHAAENQLIEAEATLGKQGAQNASVRSAVAALEQAQLNFSYTRIYASADGTVVNFSLRPGDMITVGQSLFDLVEDSEWWVDANFKETQLQHIKSGDVSQVVLDMYPKHVFQGRVLFVSPGSGSAFSILPPENATGNWVKVTQRFPVKVLISNSKKYPLRIGASATADINTEQFAHASHPDVKKQL